MKIIKWKKTSDATKASGTKLSKKNLIYSLSLALLLMCLIVGYFIFMLPSLYVSFMENANLNSIKKQHQSYLDYKSYQDTAVNNPAGCFTIDVPMNLESESVYFTNKAMRAQIDATDDNTKQLLSDIKDIVMQVRSDSSLLHDDDWKQQVEDRCSQWKDTFSSSNSLSEKFPIKITVLDSRDYSEFFSAATSKTHMMSDDTFILETGVHDSKNSFTNYIAATLTDEHLIISYLPVMTPKMNEILPVVLQSVPMIAAVLLLIVLLFSQFYSKGIVTPIVKLVRHTKTVRVTGIKSAHVPEIKGCEEVTTLGNTLNDLYDELRSSYAQLEEKNQSLAEENEQKEVFLRSSSHQLKTPIAAALLLLDGIINQIGKYKDTAVYLPQVKQQLLSMKKIVDDILYLNHCGDNLSFETFELDALFNSVLSAYDIEIANKHLKLECEDLTNVMIITDYNLISKILDNLVANAVAYTPAHNRIVISIVPDQCELKIINYGTQIDEQLLPNIFEPFVSGNHDSKCHGLGLYIVAYYAKKLQISVTIDNLAPISNGDTMNQPELMNNQELTNNPELKNSPDLSDTIGVCTTVHFEPQHFQRNE